MDGLDPQETEVVLGIVTAYFRKVAGSEQEAERMLQALASAIQEDGAKLVHLGDYVFLILVRAKGVVEVHTMGDTNNPRTLAQSLKDLAAYLKSVGVTTAYTYAEDKKFLKLAKMVNLDVEQYKSSVNDKPVNVFLVKL